MSHLLLLLGCCPVTSDGDRRGGNGGKEVQSKITDLLSVDKTQ